MVRKIYNIRKIKINNELHLKNYLTILTITMSSRVKLSYGNSGLGGAIDGSILAQFMVQKRLLPITLDFCLLVRVISSDFALLPLFNF